MTPPPTKSADGRAKLLTLDDALALFHQAGLTDLTLVWLRGQIERGELPAVVVARRRRVREDRVLGLIEKWVKKA